MPSHTDPLFDRAAGCLMGQIAGDSLGGLVEFCSPATIRERYPDGPRLLEDGGTWNILAGQPTDDSEMALMLARLLAEAVEYDAEEARRRYLFWLESGPFDMGRTIALGLRGHPDPDSQANGALMRVSPLGIFGATRHWHDVARWAQQDAALTHAHPVCQQANALYACLIAQAIRSGDSPQDLYAWLLRLARRQRLEPCLYEILELAPHEAPADYVHKMGWVRIALHNALWQLLHAPTLEEGVVDTVRAAVIRTPTPPSAGPCWEPCTVWKPSRRNGDKPSLPAARRPDDRACTTPALTASGPSMCRPLSPACWKTAAISAGNASAPRKMTCPRSSASPDAAGRPVP